MTRTYLTASAGAWRIEHRDDVAAADVLNALAEPGVILKQSRKAVTRRVGPWVVKASAKGLKTAAKLTCQPARGRCGWTVAQTLTERGVPVPEPIAFCERRTGPLILGNAMLTAYLEGYVNVEQHAAARVAESASPETIRQYLTRLADAVRALHAAGAQHRDLSGKNILTRDGSAFVFIDLDAVVLDQPYSEADRVKNHAQLYDSFCDWWDAETLAPLTDAFLPPGADPAAWLTRVQDHQARRRARTEAIWARNGRPTDRPA